MARRHVNERKKVTDASFGWVRCQATARLEWKRWP